MTNLKTKFDKHAKDNEKRRRSIKEKEKTKTNQSLIIKKALSNSILSNNSSKKVIFNDDNEDVSNLELENSSSTKNYKRKSVLFDNSGSETEDFQIKENIQFDGKKGFELLNLQSTYGNDERFKIDRRFLEDEKEESSEENNERNHVHAVGEKAEQLKILESLVGTSVTDLKKEKKEKKRINEMIRYDTSNKDHKIYEINTQSHTMKTVPLKKKWEERKKTKIDKEELPKVSKKKFYDISSDIKNHFKEKTKDGQFSLLQTYGLNNVEKDEESEEVKKESSFSDYFGDDSKKNYELIKKHKMAENKLNSENKAVLNESKVQKSGTLAKGIWKESFFFNQDDPRFKEGLEFINKKNSEEARDAGQNYDKTRKKIKEILRLHLKKHLYKKDPFKNKIGGMNKKQIANSKTKYSKMNCSKRKPLKKNLSRF